MKAPIVRLSFLTFLLSSFSALSGLAANWNLDQSHSSIKFAIDHMMISETEGRFENFNLTVVSEGEDLTNATAKLVIPVKSINTDDKKRDDHLRNADFFDVKKFPEITIEDAKIVKTPKGHALKGKLTIKGVTKDITWDAKYSGTIKDPYGNTRAGLKITGELDRQDFGLKYNSVLDNGGLAIGNEVRVRGNIELVMAK